MPDAPNVVRIPFALSRFVASSPPNRPELKAISELPRPRRLFVLGGPTLYWKLPEPLMIASLLQLIGIATRDGGSVLAIGSPRTPKGLLDAVAAELAKTQIPTFMAPLEGTPSYPAMIEAADEIYVTADSVAMVADAVNTGKLVGMIPIAKSALGTATIALADWLRPGKRLFPRDLRFFWASLQEHGFGGTIEEPRASDPPDFTNEIAERVKQLLGLVPAPAKAGRDSAR